MNFKRLFKKYLSARVHWIKNNSQKILTASCILVLVLFLFARALSGSLQTRYAMLSSQILLDRNRKEIEIKPNEKGFYSRPLAKIPARFEELLLKKEDRFFYWHPGINPISVARDLFSYIRTGRLKGSSTLTQQTVKILLGNENNRTLKNKLIETVYTLSLELMHSKKDILAMYANTAYVGNQAQGVEEAAQFYFGISADALNDVQTLSLLTALNNPSVRYPGSSSNNRFIPILADALHRDIDEKYRKTFSHLEIRTPTNRTSETGFELRTLKIPCKETCVLSVDRELTQTLRAILKKDLSDLRLQEVENGAIVVIKLPENELIAQVGSPAPFESGEGYQINMAIQPRPIGSVIKPFIYMNAFEKGARPYTLVEDREYKYEIGTGFAFYPKNYDGEYRGTVTLHQALSNSLNVPSVKVLEYVGLPQFYTFLTNDLRFKPIQPLENYGLGIALGGLEMDLLTLAHYVTAFPNGGILKPLAYSSAEPGKYLTPPMERGATGKIRVGSQAEVQLVNKILSDRDTGVEQFGIKSDLNIPAKNYALKTGTSRDFHDSWTIGYTPDFLVGVWIGNSSNKPMERVSGQMGAGKIWHDAMELLLSSEYNKDTPFAFDNVHEFREAGTIQYGLEGDDYEHARLLMQEHTLILSPHNGDTFLFEPGMTIPFRASEDAEWFVNGNFTGKGKEIVWRPEKEGNYAVTAEGEGQKEKLVITIKVE